MARKASPEELAMHASNENDLEALIENANGPATDNTANGDIETDTQAPKRKRGRPSAAEKTLTETLEKEIPGAAQPDVSVAKPGRKPSKKSAPSAEALGRQLVGVHQLAAMFLQIPEVQITEAEGNTLGAAIINVCEEYNLAISGKTGAAIQLLAAAAMIYAPRAFIVKARIDQARQQQTVNPHVQPAGAH